MNNNNFQNQNWNNSSTTANNQQQTFQGQSNTQTQQPPSMMMKLMSSCLPVLLEQFTGQSIPTMGGNNAEIQLALSQVLTLQQQMVNDLRELIQRVMNLETRASQQFTGLAQQVQRLGSVRLTHDRERKQVEFHGDVSSFDKSRQFNSNHQQETN